MLLAEGIKADGFCREILVGMLRWMKFIGMLWLD